MEESVDIAVSRFFETMKKTHQEMRKSTTNGVFKALIQELDVSIEKEIETDRVLQSILGRSTTLDELRKTLSTITHSYCVDSTFSFLMLRVCLTSLDLIHNELKNLPDKKEFVHLKQIVVENEEKVKQTLQPIKEAIEEAQKRGNDVYG